MRRAQRTGVAVGKGAGRDLTQNWAGTAIGTPHSSLGVPPLAPNPNVSDGDQVQPSGGMICADLPVAVSVPSGCTVQLPLRIGSVTTLSRSRSSRLRSGGTDHG